MAESNVSIRDEWANQQAEFSWRDNANQTENDCLLK